MHEVEDWWDNYNTAKQVWFWWVVFSWGLSILAVAGNMIFWMRAVHGGVRHVWQNVWGFVIVLAIFLALLLGTVVLVALLV